ncbi:hypothetical protein QKW52_11160 [Bacillus sonorensis]|nr:hypothetical protein [Bacillus sonorensis]
MEDMFALKRPVIPNDHPKDSMNEISTFFIINAPVIPKNTIKHKHHQSINQRETTNQKGESVNWKNGWEFACA